MIYYKGRDPPTSDFVSLQAISPTQHYSKKIRRVSMPPLGNMMFLAPLQ
jgi:hypothetical protein